MTREIYNCYYGERVSLIGRAAAEMSQVSVQVRYPFSFVLREIYTAIYERKCMFMLKTIMTVGSVILAAAECIALIKFKKTADEAMAERIKKYDSDENEIEAEAKVILIMEEP